MVESVETVIGQINRKSGGLGMPYVSPVVENDFKDRLNKCVDIIKNSSIKYQSFGIFGSYARNDYKASSDTSGSGHLFYFIKKFKELTFRKNEKTES